jgi:hypothetical protein
VLCGTQPHERYRGSKLYTRLKVAGVDVAAMGTLEPELESDEVVQIVEERRYSYRKLIIRDQRLVGAMLVGVAAAAAPLVAAGLGVLRAARALKTSCSAFGWGLCIGAAGRYGLASRFRSHPTYFEAPLQTGSDQSFASEQRTTLSKLAAGDRELASTHRERQLFFFRVPSNIELCPSDVEAERPQTEVPTTAAARYDVHVCMAGFQRKVRARRVDCFEAGACAGIQRDVGAVGEG